MQSRTELGAAQRVARGGMLVGLGVALHAAESLLLSPLPLPGLKLGLANIATLLALELGGVEAAFTVAVLRVSLATLVAGSFLSVSFALSLSGALVSALFIAWGRRWGGTRLTSRGLGVAGAAAHNLGQVAAFWLLTGQRAALLYLPPLLLLAVPAGACTGTAAALLQPFVLRRLERQEVVEAYSQALSQEGDGW